LRGAARRPDNVSIEQADVVGIDRGVCVPVALSTGDMLGHEVESERHRRKQRRLAKALARTQRGSKRRMKAVVRLRVHKARMARRRRDMIHQITAQIVKRHRVIVIENLRVKAMTASARGTAEDPGRNVAAQAGLNRSILDKGWGEMRRQLAYKLSWSGGRLIEVDPRNTSRTCGCCGIVDAASRIYRDRFSCWSCGYQEHADTNAARVIRQRGLLAL